MPIRLRIPGCGLTPLIAHTRFRSAARRAGTGSDARAGTGPLLAICVWFCLQMSSGILASQQTTAQPPAAPASPQTPIDAAVREALKQYSAALESLNADQVKKIHPSVDSENLKRAFKEARELKVTIDSIKVLSSDGATARVSCRVTQVFTPRAGTKQNSAVTRVMLFRRQDTAWVIDGFER
jgi:hypothetical protein